MDISALICLLSSVKGVIWDSEGKEGKERKVEMVERKGRKGKTKEGNKR